MKIGDIVKPSEEWYKEKVFDKINTLYYLYHPKETIEDLTILAKEFYKYCFGKVEKSGNTANAVKWLNKAPSILNEAFYYAWFQDKDLILIESYDLDKKYIHNEYKASNSI